MTKNSRAARAHQLKYKYGITLKEYEQMLEDQEGVCAICFGDRSKVTKALSVDHDGTMMRGDRESVRGLLCSPCNQGLGYFAHDENLLFQAIRYLRNTTKK